MLLFCVSAAGAEVLCRKDAFTMVRMHDVCGDSIRGSQNGCVDYHVEFMTNCNIDISESRMEIERLSNLTERSPADEAKLTEARTVLERARASLIDAKNAGIELAKDNGEGMIPYFMELHRKKDAIDALAGEALSKLEEANPPTTVKPEVAALITGLANKVSPKKAVENAVQAGDQALAEGRTDDAEHLGEALVKSAPTDYRGPSLLAEAALSEHRPADAARWAQKALELNPRDKKAADALAFARSELSAQKLKKPVVGSFQEARALELERSLAAATIRPPPAGPAAAPDPKAAAKSADPVQRVLSGLLRRGYEKMRLDDLPGALGDVSVHLDSHPEDAEARLIRAEILLKLGKPGPALADIDAALAKSPDDPRALRARAAALYEIGGRDGEALKTIERALELEPASGIGHLTRAKLLERLDRIPEAIEEYRAAAQLDPTLEPITEAALRRLGAAPAPSKAVEKGLLRGGFLVVSLALILMGLVGGAVVVTRRARTADAAAAAQERTLKAGDLVAGQYRISRELGRGGMGVVFEAIDEKLKRSVALKQLQGDFRASAEDAARFLQEARLVAQLRHPNVAEIYAAVEDGGLYLVFELVSGRSLDALLGSGVTPEQARGIVAHACAALTAAHARRIVHRDLKPSNMMVTDDGQLKVMDFGIAHQSLGGGAFTQTSASGTPPYMAPEQAMGSVSSASDLYALGVMAYELLAGVRPFAGPDFLGPKMRGEFAPVTSRKASLPARLDAFFASALSPDPTRRPKDAAAFAAAFAACWS